jgi:hypothetical protein
MSRLLRCLLLVFVVQCSATRHTSAISASDAVLYGDRLIIVFPSTPPGVTQWGAPNTGALPGYYDWRFGVNGPSPFAASAGISAGEANAREARGSLAAVAPSLRLRRCTSGGHILTCADSLAGTITVADDRVIVTVRDPGVLLDIRRTAPRYVWRAVFLPDTILPLDSVPLRYQP